VALLLLTALGLGSALPSTPGYVGIYQFVAVTVLTPFGIGRDEALAFILVLQVLGSGWCCVWPAWVVPAEEAKPSGGPPLS